MYPVRYTRIDKEQVSGEKKYKVLGWFFMLAFIGLLIGSSQVRDNNVRNVLIILVLVSMGLCACFCTLGHRPKTIISSFENAENEIV